MTNPPQEVIDAIASAGFRVVEPWHRINVDDGDFLFSYVEKDDQERFHEVFAVTAASSTTGWTIEILQTHKFLKVPHAC